MRHYHSRQRIFLKPRFMRAVLLLMLFFSSMTTASELVWHEIDIGVSDHLGFGKERVAVLLRAKINDVDCRVQLDTGAASDIIWHSQRNHTKQAEPVKVRVQIGDIVKVLPVEAAHLTRLQGPDCDGVIATVGNGFFDHGTLHLDLAGERFAFTPRAGLAHHPAARPMLYLPATPRGGHPLVMVTLANGAHGNVLLDTGSMRFGLVATSEQQWLSITASVHRLSERTFNIGNAIEAGILTCREFETPVLMTLAGQSVRQELLTYCPGKQFHLAQPLLGVLGLRSLGHRMFVIDYVSGRWLLEDEQPAVHERMPGS